MRQIPIITSEYNAVGGCGVSAAAAEGVSPMIKKNDTGVIRSDIVTPPVIVHGLPPRNLYGEVIGREDKGCESGAVLRERRPHPRLYRINDESRGLQFIPDIELVIEHRDVLLGSCSVTPVIGETESNFSSQVFERSFTSRKTNSHALQYNASESFHSTVASTPCIPNTGNSAPAKMQGRRASPAVVGAQSPVIQHYTHRYISGGQVPMFYMSYLSRFFVGH